MNTTGYKRERGISSGDPFDIRDLVYSLEPMLQLDRKRLATLVSNRVHLNVPAWRRWTPTIGVAAVCDWQVVFENRGEGYFFPALSLQGAPVILSRTVQPSETRKWLQVDMRQNREGNNVSQLIKKNVSEVGFEPTPTYVDQNTPVKERVCS